MSLNHYRSPKNRWQTDYPEVIFYCCSNTNSFDKHLNGLKFLFSNGGFCLVVEFRLGGSETKVVNIDLTKTQAIMTADFSKSDFYSVLSTQC